jgi:signal transduction histidine kinase
MHEEESLRDIPVIFVSAMTETSDKLRAFEAGGVDYVTKPFSFEEVEARVRAHLELQNKRAELARANGLLTELERAREALTHMIVHDMRTPLTGLSGFLEIISMTETEHLSENGRHLLELAQASTDRLGDMVGAVLDVSRLENGTRGLSRSRFEIRGLIEEVAGSWRPEQKCDLRIVAESEAEVDADRGLLTRSLRALLGNACQASKEGGLIRLSLTLPDEDFEMAVEDQGIPIPIELRDAIFRRAGAGETEKRKYATGMGLTLCRMVAEAHGGRAGVECGEGVGRRFWMRLPRGAKKSDAH